jgi:hypothetical protein
VRVVSRESVVAVSVFGAATALGLIVAVGFLGVCRVRVARDCGRNRCRSNLSQIALACLQYADDKKWFPTALGPPPAIDATGHLVPPDDGRVARAVVRHGYVDNPELFVCNMSDDVAPPLDGIGPTSYGFGARRLSGTAHSDLPIVADRARRDDESSDHELCQPIRGNHAEGWNVACVDGHLTWVGCGDPQRLTLSGTGKEDGWLVVWDDANNGLPPRAPSPHPLPPLLPPETPFAWSDEASVGVAGLFAIALAAAILFSRPRVAVSSRE